ncbi:hypothetical protein ACFL3V_05585 [Nanoarchaeota archaeon]
MKGARQTILIKAEQMMKMNHHFQGKQMMDTININHFSHSLEYDYFHLLKR